MRLRQILDEFEGLRGVLAVGRDGINEACAGPDKRLAFAVHRREIPSTEHLKLVGDGPAPWGPQSNCHDQLPPQLMTRSPAGNILYLGMIQGEGLSNGWIGMSFSLVKVS